jgi:hypothetical protein
MTFNQVPALRQIIEGLFPIALPGPVKNSLWARYQALLSKHGPDATLTDIYIERIERPNGHVIYRFCNEYAKSTLAMDPNQLLDLLVYLSDNENLIRQDAQANDKEKEAQS